MLPARPKIYHITHLDNLAQIVDAYLWSDAERIRQTLDCTVVGMSRIKRRRLELLSVGCHRGTKVGEYVPFYFCPRSVMLFLLHCGNNPDLSYRGGQTPIIHLEADLREVVAWADHSQRRWAFTNRNAGMNYTSFFKNLDRLDELDWDAIQATDWRESVVREAKQAEFLVFKSFPWTLVSKIGVIDTDVAQKVTATIRNANHHPQIAVERNWYY